MTGQTLEQRRARDAWDCCGPECDREYANLAKALPALIMNSGLMQVMAFLHGKGGVHERLASHLRAWLHRRFRDHVPPGFAEFMESLLKTEPHTYQAVTAEAFAWLKWLRQMAAARQKGS